eukprot:3004550-Rhodomonas_salina.3
MLGMYLLGAVKALGAEGLIGAECVGGGPQVPPIHNPYALPRYPLYTHPTHFLCHVRESHRGTALCTPYAPPMPCPILTYGYPAMHSYDTDL